MMQRSVLRLAVMAVLAKATAPCGGPAVPTLIPTSTPIPTPTEAS